MKLLKNIQKQQQENSTPGFEEASPMTNQSQNQQSQVSFDFGNNSGNITNTYYNNVSSAYPCVGPYSSVNISCGVVQNNLDYFKTDVWDSVGGAGMILMNPLVLSLYSWD